MALVVTLVTKVITSLVVQVGWSNAAKAARTTKAPTYTAL